MNVKNVNTSWTDIIGLGSIGLVSIGYVLFAARFAERHVQFGFLDFPVFVSEFLLMFCFSLFILKLSFKPIKINSWHVLIGMYFGFVLIKTFFGYVHFGPLALRNAALMYYPIFAIFGYMFFQRKYFHQIVNVILLLIICFIFLKKDYYAYYTLTLFVLAIILIGTLKNRLGQFVMGGIILFLLPYVYFFHDTARMMILAHLIFSLYMIVIAYIFLKWPHKVKLMVAVFCMVGIVVAMVKFSGEGRIKSIFHFSGIGEIFRECDSRIREKKSEFSFSENKNVKIYHPELAIPTELQSADGKVIQPEISMHETGTDVVVQTKREATVQTTSANEVGEEVVIQEEKQETVQSKDTFEADANNSVFRLLIWRDMLVEYRQYHPLFGFSFGKPLRSISLEVLHWAESEWGRDGWVAAHNSFLHLVYRSGIVGVVFIISIFVILFNMIKDFLMIRSLTGVLLCGLIISWVVACNFLIVLEIPYTAIPIWTLCGMTFAYYQLKMQQKKGNHELER